ncbi:hypothetical protein [Lactiplantibacillus daowaiensis]|uniref:Cell surface protein n=1 Tax=Lactiplantibacillus daowaiensis TaxID=2559918 RepID=A0ABW1S3D5_9LACO
MHRHWCWGLTLGVIIVLGLVVSCTVGQSTAHATAITDSRIRPFHESQQTRLHNVDTTGVAILVATTSLGLLCWYRAKLDTK